MDPDPLGPEQRVRSYRRAAADGTAPVRDRVRDADVSRDDNDVSRDDADVGWGDIPPARSARDEWYLAERPPHHG